MKERDQLTERIKSPQPPFSKGGRGGISYFHGTYLHNGLLINFGNKSCQVKRVVF
jgi:hypothetical protein